MKIAGLQKLTLLDYPGKTAATVFTPGCNFRCPFCYNKDLVLGLQEDGAFPDIPQDEFFSFLESREGLLDGVCITGGEPLMQPGVEEFCARVKELGFLVKLDTNGSFPGRLRDLVQAGLVDYVALDVKNAPGRYEETAGHPREKGTVPFSRFPAEDSAEGPDPLALLVRESIDFLLEGLVDYEFRTTVVREFHDRGHLLALAEWLRGARAWFLQSFVDSPEVLAGQGRFHAWDDEELRALLPALQAIVPSTQLRGL